MFTYPNNADRFNRTNTLSSQPLFRPRQTKNMYCKHNMYANSNANWNGLIWNR